MGIIETFENIGLKNPYLILQRISFMIPSTTQMMFRACVNCPNYQTLRVIPLAARFAVTSFGLLGYECNLSEMK